MINFIPLFPLNIVVFPGEQLNLHIFEPRYKELVNECFAEAKPFGIPTVVNNSIAELGTSVQITEIVEVYPDGKMDIRTQGLEIFKIIEHITSLPEKSYSGGIVNYPPNDATPLQYKMKVVLGLLRKLHQLLHVSKTFKKPDEELISYDIAHHAGLSIEQEYEFLNLFEEVLRLKYLKRHLNNVIPIVTGTENLKERIQLNGHFKELSGFNFQ